MPVHALHHFNFRAPAAKLRALRDFYCDVLGFVEGPRPPFRVPGFWLYAGGAPILHLVEIASANAATGFPAQPAALDHVALKCSDFDAMVERLRASGIEHTVTHVPGAGDTQIFCTDPSGLGVELNFPAK